MIPLKISLSFDRNNLSKNGITVELYNYTKAIWNDNYINPSKANIFDESYLELL